MKLQIKTLNQKSLVIDIEETKTVYDLKKELAQYPDIGVKPELQKIIYAGQILVNEEKLSTYNINVKKFLVIMTIKQPMEKAAKDTQTIEKDKEVLNAAATSTSTAAVSAKAAPEIKPPAMTKDQKNERLVAQIVAMGYPETDARRALAASFYNPERAIQYLIEGIPTSPSAPEGDSFSSTETDTQIPSPFTLFRNDPVYAGLRNAVQQNPSVLDHALYTVGQTSPVFSQLVNEYQEEFLSLLIEGSDEEDSDDGGMVADDD